MQACAGKGAMPPLSSTMMKDSFFWTIRPQHRQISETQKSTEHNECLATKANAAIPHIRSKFQL
eukprot:1150585-Pelagomonas_calceolata.AAC.4